MPRNEYEFDETEEDPSLDATLIIINWNEAGLQELYVTKIQAEQDFQKSI